MQKKGARKTWYGCMVQVISWHGRNARAAGLSFQSGIGSCAVKKGGMQSMAWLHGKNNNSSNWHGSVCYDI